MLLCAGHFHVRSQENPLFTFGREHERKCAVAYVRNPAQAELILQVVDAVHDFLEGKAPKEPLSQTIRTEPVRSFVCEA